MSDLSKFIGLKTLDEAAWNAFVRTLATSFAVLEDRQAAQDRVVAGVVERGLGIVTEQIEPLVGAASDAVAAIDLSRSSAEALLADVTDRATQLGLVFTATSATPVEMSGTRKVFVVPPAARPAFLPLPWMEIAAASDWATRFVARLVDYDRDTGELTVDPVSVAGTGTRSSWWIGPVATVDVSPVLSVAGRSGAVTLDKGDVGLGAVDDVRQAPLTHVGSTDGHPLVTSSVAGFMSPEDKAYLGILSLTFVSVRAFGAVGDGIADDTAAFLLAIAAVQALGYGVVWVPAGRYKITANLRVIMGNVHIVGAGRGVSIIYGYVAGDVITFASDLGIIHRNAIRGLTVLNQIVQPTEGATVHFSRCNQAHFHDCDFREGFVGLWLESVVGSYCSDVDLGADTLFTSYLAGSALMLISKHAAGNIPSEMQFANVDWRGQNINYYLDAAIKIRDADGIFFSSGHVGMARTGIKLAPSSDTATLLSCDFSNIYVDNCSDQGVYAIEPSASYSGYFGKHNIRLAEVHHCGVAVAWSCAATHWSTVDVGVIHRAHGHAVSLYKGSRVRVRSTVAGCNTTNVNGAGVTVGAGFSKWRVDGLTVEQGDSAYPPNRGVVVADGSTDFVIEGLSCKDCGKDVDDQTGTADKRIAPWKTDKSAPAIAAAATVTFPEFHTFVITGASTVTAISGRAWEGREVTFITNGGAVTFTAGTTIGNTFTTTANVPVRATYMWGKWWFR